VSGLVEAHLPALDALRAGSKAETFNRDWGRRLSVREIVATVERVAGCKLPTRAAPRRAADPPALVANPAMLKKRSTGTPIMTMAKRSY
jgi:UDP-glucose 4-epimerase